MQPQRCHLVCRRSIGEMGACPWNPCLSMSVYVLKVIYEYGPDERAPTLPNRYRPVKLGGKRTAPGTEIVSDGPDGQWCGLYLSRFARQGISWTWTRWQKPHFPGWKPNRLAVQILPIPYPDPPMIRSFDFICMLGGKFVVIEINHSTIFPFATLETNNLRWSQQKPLFIKQTQAWGERGWPRTACSMSGEFGTFSTSIRGGSAQVDIADCGKAACSVYLFWKSGFPSDCAAYNSTLGVQTSDPLVLASVLLATARWAHNVKNAEQLTIMGSKKKLCRIVEAQVCNPSKFAVTYLRGAWSPQQVLLQLTRDFCYQKRNVAKHCTIGNKNPSRRIKEEFIGPIFLRIQHGI